MSLLIFLIWFKEAAAHAPSFLTLSFSPLSSFLLPHRAILLLAGDLTQWHLPVGMKDLDLAATNVTGKATSE